MHEPPDYRLSHLQKGLDYDEDLASRPFDAYLSHWQAHHLGRWLERHAQHLPQGALDFACGTGRITRLLEEHVRGDLVGVDVSPSMLRVARARCARAHLLQVDLTAADADPELPATVGLITAFRFFGNAQPSLRGQALEALSARLAPRGRLILDLHRNAGAVYARLDRLTGGDANGMDLTLRALDRLLRQHGLVMERLIPIGAWLWRSSILHRAPTPPPHHRAADSLSWTRAQRWERRLGHGIWSGWSPAFIVIARHAV